MEKCLEIPYRPASFAIVLLDSISFKDVAIGVDLKDMHTELIFEKF